MSMAEDIIQDQLDVDASKGTGGELDPDQDLSIDDIDSSTDVCPQCGSPMIHECFTCKSRHKGRNPRNGTRYRT